MRAAIHDIIPQHHLFNHVTQAWATGSCHWFFMIQPAPMPERLMSADPGFLHREEARQDQAGPSFFGKEALEEYKRCFRNPATVHAMCEDYRACAGIDLAMDTEDFEGRQEDRPARCCCCGARPAGRASRTIRRRSGRAYATDIRDAQALPCGHYLMEEAPEETYAAMRAFFAALVNLRCSRADPSEHCRAAICRSFASRKVQREADERWSTSRMRSIAALAAASFAAVVSAAHASPDLPGRAGDPAGARPISRSARRLEADRAPCRARCRSTSMRASSAHISARCATATRPAGWKVDKRIRDTGPVDRHLSRTANGPDNISARTRRC